MSFLLFLKLLPNFMKITALAHKKIKQGLHEDKVLEAMDASTEAFNCESVEETEKRINDIWNPKLCDKPSNK